MWFSFFITWEQRKLGDLGKAQSGIGFPDKEQGGKTGIPFFKVSDMNNVGNELEMNRSNNYVSPDQIKKNGWSPIEETSVIFAKVGAAIMLNRKRLVRFPFLLDNNTMAYKFSDSWDIEFGRTLFERIDLTSLVQVGALPSYNAGDVENMEAAIPQMAEQYKLGALFKSLDNLITLHQRKQNWQNSRFLRKISSLILAIAWEQRKFGSIVYRTNEMSDTDGLPRVEYEDIEAGQGTLNKDLKEKVSTKKGIVFQYGDILYGKLRPYLKNWLFAWFSGIAVGDFWVLRSNLVSHSFIYRLVQTPAFDYIANQSTGSKMPRADWNLVSNSEFTLPLSAEEQEAIGQIFLKLDNLITLHQCEEILIHNEYGSSSLFRSQYKMANAWEQRKVYEVAERYDNLRVPVAANLRVRGNIPYYGANGIQDYVDGFTHDGEFVLVAEDGANDLKNYPVQRVNGRIWVNNHAHVLQGKPDLMDNLFFAYSLHRADIASFLVGGSRAKLNADTLMTLELLLPCVVEQTKIGRLFDDLDNLITLHQCKRAAFVSRKSPSIFQFEKWRNTLTWEQRKCKELCSITTGKSNTQDQVEDGLYPFYIRSDMPVRSNKYLYDCEAVITIGDGQIGKVFHYVNGKFDLHQRCYKMADFVGIFGKYFFYYCSTKFYDRAIKMTAKATVDSVRMDMIAEMDIQYPISSQEQRQIALFL